MILAIDCSDGFNIIIFNNKKILFTKNFQEILNISEILIPKIESICRKINITYKSFKIIIIVNGPGSFTGIRTSVTFAKILSLSLSVPVYGFSKFDIIDFLKTQSDQLTTILIYKNKNSFYRAQYKKHRLIGEVELISKNKLEYNFKYTKNEQIISDNILNNGYYIALLNLENHINIAKFNFKISIFRRRKNKI